MIFLSGVTVSVNRRRKNIKGTFVSFGQEGLPYNVKNMETRYFHNLKFLYAFHRILLWIQGLQSICSAIGLQLHICFIKFDLVMFRENREK